MLKERRGPLYQTGHLPGTVVLDVHEEASEGTIVDPYDGGSGSEVAVGPAREG